MEAIKHHQKGFVNAELFQHLAPFMLLTIRYFTHKAPITVERMENMASPYAVPVVQSLAELFNSKNQ